MHSQLKQRRLRFLITAGGTREYIDPVRFISNASSGKMGYELARAAAARSHSVTLITTIRTPKLKTITVDTTDEMFRAVKKNFPKCDCLIMAAAVADYTPVETRRLKMKRGSKAILLKLKPTPDILKWASDHKRQGQIVIGFALDDINIKANAERKMRVKNLDMVIANKPSAIGADKSSVWIKAVNGNWLSAKNMSKSAIAKKVVRIVENAFHKK
jgi:phosphopantothenoylcysteine decarboxylase/phosphopantothenate--cysteine ligase